MSFPQSLKARLDLLVELHPRLRPLRTVISFLLTLRFKLVNASLRNWLLLRFVVVRLLWGKKLLVVYRDVGIGDIVNTFPFIAELKKVSSHEVIVYVTHRQFHSFVRKFSSADVVIGTSYVLFSQPLPRIPAWVATKALHPLYIGEDPASPKGERLGYVLEMARSCGISLSDPRPKLTVDDAEALSVLRRHNYGRNSRPYIGIHLGPTVPVREWPFESWRQLVELLRQRLEATIFQFGSKWHSSHPGEMEETLPVQINLTNRLNLIETTQLISKMDLFIGIDSGLLHIANATGVPLIGLFGPTDPAIVIPGHPTAGLFSAELPCIFCQHRGLNLHWKTGCPYDIQCMHLLSSDLVFAKAKAILQSTSPSPNVEK